MTKFALGLALVAALFVAGCGDVSVPEHPDPLGHRDDDETAQVRLRAEDVKFLPDEITASAGVTTELTLENLDDVEHDFQIDEIDAEVIDGGSDGDEHGGEHGSAALAVHTDEGETASLTFVAIEPGTYEFYCTVSGHREAGMVGTLTVE